MRTKYEGMNITVTLFSSKPVSFGWITVTSALLGAPIFGGAGSLKTVLPISSGKSRLGGAEQPPEVFT